jgi:predicted esterase
MPLFIGQGDADHVVPVSATTHSVEKLCPAGNKLTYKIYEGTNHFSIVPDAEADVLAWMQTLRSGGDPGTTCTS